MEQELEDLQQRFALLEGDRKAFYEQSQVTLKHNKDTADELRAENKDLKQALSALRKERANCNKGVTEAQLEADVSRAEAQLTALRSQHNKLTSANRAKEGQLAAEDADLREMQLAAQTCQKPSAQGNGPAARQIRTLENRLDKAMIKHNEAKSIRKTYDQIARRLREERVSFDKQLQALEEEIKAKDQDMEELRVMSHDAAHAKDGARADLSKLQAVVEAERRTRERELAERRNALCARRELNARMAERAQRSALAAAPEDAHALVEAGPSELDPGAGDADRAVLHTYESAFRRIRDATGVSDVGEVVEKFKTQEATHVSLIQQTEEARAKIKRLAAELAKTKAAVDEMKYAGGAGPGSRHEVDSAERKHQEATQALERAKVRHQRLHKIFVDVRIGLEHLCARLDPARHDWTVTEDNLVEVMQHCESRLEKLLASRGGAHASAGAPDLSTAKSNLRVRLDAEEDTVVEEDREVDGPEEDVLDRTRLKSLNNELLEKEEVKRRRRVGAAGGGAGRGARRRPA